MVYLTTHARWMRFQNYTHPLTNAKMLKHMSISQLDSFAASLVAAAEIFGIDCQITKFNRLDGNFDFSYKPNDVYRGWKGYEERFDDLVLFLKYIYKIDTQNRFVKKFVASGNSSSFEKLFDTLTGEEIYFAFKKIKKTHELIDEFFKKIKLGKDYSLSVKFWEDHSEKLKNKGEATWD